MKVLDGLRLEAAKLFNGSAQLLRLKPVRIYKVALRPLQAYVDGKNKQEPINKAQSKYQLDVQNDQGFVF